MTEIKIATEDSDYVIKINPLSLKSTMTVFTDIQSNSKRGHYE